MKVVRIDAEVVQDVAVVLHHAFGLTRRAGRVKDISEPVRIHARKAMAADRRIDPLDIQQLHLCIGQPPRWS